MAIPEQLSLSLPQLQTAQARVTADPEGTLPSAVEAAQDGSDADEAERQLKAAIVREAHDRFRRCADWEATARQYYRDDFRFASGDAYNHFQWPNDIRQQRDYDKRPSLTVNKVRQHNLQIINESKQRKPGVLIRPVSGEASYKAAEMLEGIVRHIEYQSNAQDAYDTATECQVKGGFGVWRIVTKYIDDQSFDQDIFIERLPDPFCVYLDPMCKEADYSDAKFGFIFIDTPKDEFEKEFPEYKGMDLSSPLGNIAGSDWYSDKNVRSCEYYRVVEIPDELFAVPKVNPQTGQPGVDMILLSTVGEALAEPLRSNPMVRSRKVSRKEVQWFKIIGGAVVDQTIWPGTTVPIVLIVGEETVIEGIMDRKGHTRSMIDPQRMYNYWTSAATYHVALQSVSPWVVAEDGISGFEEVWKTANTTGHAYLPYNHLDDQGQPIPPPQRAQPPQMAQAYIEGMRMTQMEMMTAAGQYQAEMGQSGNERSAKAINMRQNQGDIATFHFRDNLAKGVRRTGKIILELIPKVYDTKRILTVIAQDGQDMLVTVDPQAKQAYAEELTLDNEVANRILNPAVGRYEVRADMGPAYSTKRQEAFDAFQTIVSQNAPMAQIIGDLMMQSADFPQANKAAERLRRMVPPQALGKGPSQQEQQLQIQVTNLQKSLDEALRRLGDEQSKALARDQKQEVSAYNAITQRWNTVLKSGSVPEADLGLMIHGLIGDSIKAHLAKMFTDDPLDKHAPPPIMVPPPPQAPQEAPGQPPGAPQ